MSPKKSNVTPIKSPVGRWQPINLMVAAFVLVFFFGSLFLIVHQAWVCDQHHGVFVRTLYWFACVKDNDL